MIIMPDKNGFGNDIYDIVNMRFDGAHGSTTFTDTSSLAHAFTGHGADIEISTGYSVFGDSSLSIPVGGQYIDTPASADFTMGAVWTADCWLYKVDSWSSVGVFGQAVSTTSGWGLRTTAAADKWYAEINSSTGWRVEWANPLGLNAWNHVAVEQYGTTVNLFINGTKQAVTGSLNTPAAIGYYNAAFAIGHGYAAGTGGGVYMKGYVDMFRLSKGIARYKGRNFTLPNRAY
jgi:hypothetical protein